MLELRRLKFAYLKGAEALTNASASIGGGVYLLLGENGAGKTTLLHLMAGLLYPGSGECLLNGDPIAARRPSDMQRIFFLGDNMPFPGRTIDEFVKMHAQFFPTFDPQLLADILGRFGINPAERLEGMSLGTRKKAQLAYALSLRTQVLLLDEPANGLDISSKKLLQEIIVENITEEQTIIVSTHTVWDFKNLFDGLLVLNHGQLLVASTVDEILGRIAFVSASEPPVGALYIERVAGRFNAIVKNDGDTDTDIDYVLLYSALMNADARDNIVKLLND